MPRPLRVGIIGANARGGWAGISHVPAVQGLEGLTLAAVATNGQATADGAAPAFGVSRAYAGGIALIADPDIDVVTVATRVPDHRALVLAAMAAGKHVYSEWPLGRGRAESDEIAEAAKTARVHHAVGLQLRGSPAVRAARDRLAAGHLGRLLSVSAFSSSAGFGPAVAEPFIYLEDPAAFANLVTIQGAHTLDLVMALGGAATGLSALPSRQFPEITVGEDKERRRRETFDHLLVQGRLAIDAPFAVEVAGGRDGATPFWLEVVCENGMLRLEGGAPRGLQSSRITLTENDERVPIDDGELAGLPDTALNVGGIYAMLRDDVRHGTTASPTFDHAAQVTRMVETVLRSSVERRMLTVEEK